MHLRVNIEEKISPSHNDVLLREMDAALSSVYVNTVCFVVHDVSCTSLYCYGYIVDLEIFVVKKFS